MLMALIELTPGVKIRAHYASQLSVTGHSTVCHHHPRDIMAARDLDDVIERSEEFQHWQMT